MNLAVHRATVAVLSLGLGLGLAACGPTQAAPPANAAAPAHTALAPTATSTYDPYEVYLKNNPDKSLILSREDAQLRAYLGCGHNFAPGTIDAVLADAYRPMGLCSPPASPK